MRIAVLAMAQHGANVTALDCLRESGFTGKVATVARYEDEVLTINGFQTGPVTQRLYDTLTGIQWGTLPDDMGWTPEVE